MLNKLRFYAHLIFSQSDNLIRIVDTNSNTEWQTVQLQTSWLLKKPTDLDLHCLQRQGISGSSRQGLSHLGLFFLLIVGLGGSFGCASDRSRVRSPLGPATFVFYFFFLCVFFCYCCFFRLIMKYFYGHYLPSADSVRAVVSFCQNNVHKYWLTALWTKPAQEKCG